MVRSRLLVCAMIVSVLVLPITPAWCAFHLWKVQEVFTNANGSVQFIELVNGAATTEHDISGHFVRSTADGTPTTLTFPGDLPNPPSTANRHVLLATPGFAALAGVTPDYEIPTSFINLNATNYSVVFDFFDTNFTFNSALLPKDGLNSLRDHNPAGATAHIVAETNTPTNFQGVTGFVPPPIPPNNGDYNGDLTVNAADYTVWRNTLGMSVDQSSGADGNNNSTIDIGDYTFWKERYGDIVGGAGAVNGDLSSVPEPASALLGIALLALLPVRSIRGLSRADR
jgi:serralysin